MQPVHLRLQIPQTTRRQTPHRRTQTYQNIRMSTYGRELYDEKFTKILHPLSHLRCYLLRNRTHLARSYRYINGNRWRTCGRNYRRVEREDCYPASAVVFRRDVPNNTVWGNIGGYFEYMVKAWYLGLFQHARAIFLGAMLCPLLYLMVFLGWRGSIARRLAEIHIIWRIKPESCGEV